MAGRSFGRKQTYSLTVTVFSEEWCGVSTNLTANHKGSNLIPPHTKSNEGHAAIQMDVHGVFSWVKNKYGGGGISEPFVTLGLVWV
jgi:hypothetical protein